MDERTEMIPGKEPASSFYRHKEGRSTCTGNLRSRRLSSNRGCAVVGHCWKYTVGYGAGRGSHPGKSFSLAGITPAS